MDEKSLTTLEFIKILDRLAEYCSFNASIELAHNWRPTGDIEVARRRLSETSEARQLLAGNSELSMGGIRDVRVAVDLAKHGATLSPGELLDIKFTLISARNIRRFFEKYGNQFMMLGEIALQLPLPIGIIDAITLAISERGEILDTASQKLESIRHDLRISHDRLLSKLEHMVNDPRVTPYLQETLVTQRDGRYVLPLRAEFKGRIRSIVHDQSSSGATLFVEPLSVVELNNLYRENQLAERDEERRILAELSDVVGLHASEIDRIVSLLADLDLAMARGKYANEINASLPILQPIRERSDHPGTTIRLYNARHPLLDANIVVPIDVELDEHTFGMVITGPNTGGKTVTLKTIGLLVLMAQSGLHIPATSGSEISIFSNVYADIGDEQSIEQSLSTFSSHITNIIRILEKADADSLVILDELGAGTDPQEGAALARAILTYLLERRITILVTTHHPELKAYAHATPGIVNACVEFDLVTLQPTYHLTIGLPGRSNALEIARRIGLPASIIENARKELKPEDLHAEDLLNEIFQQKEFAREARFAAENAQEESELLRRELLKRLDDIDDERREILEEARLEAEEQLRQINTEIGEIRRQLIRAKQPLDPLQLVSEKIEEIEEVIEKPIIRSAEEIQRPILREIRLGDRVRLRNLNTQGTVIGFSEEEVEIQVGGLRVRSRLSDVEIVEISGKSGASESPSIGQTTAKKREQLYSASPGLELNLRGQHAEEAIENLERYLDAAFLAGLPFVRIIHGKGTGKLRQIVRETLSQHPHVLTFEVGRAQEGGEGVTVAKLINE